MSASTKTELVANVARRTGQSRKTTREVVDGFLDEVLDTMREGGRLPIEGFATFEVVERGARLGRNPRTGEALEIPDRQKVKITPGKWLKLITTDEAPEGDVFTK